MVSLWTLMRIPSLKSMESSSKSVTKLSVHYWNWPTNLATTLLISGNQQKPSTQCPSAPTEKECQSSSITPKSKNTTFSQREPLKSWLTAANTTLTRLATPLKLTKLGETALRKLSLNSQNNHSETFYSATERSQRQNHRPNTLSIWRKIWLFWEWQELKIL